MRSVLSGLTVLPRSAFSPSTACTPTAARFCASRSPSVAASCMHAATKPRASCSLPRSARGKDDMLPPCGEGFSDWPRPSRDLEELTVFLDDSISANTEGASRRVCSARLVLSTACCRPHRQVAGRDVRAVQALTQLAQAQEGVHISRIEGRCTDATRARTTWRARAEATRWTWWSSEAGMARASARACTGASATLTCLPASC